jgi:hypothetical protein
LTDVLEIAALKKLVGLDCSTPKCAANAYATGRLVRSLLIGWTLEAYCPDCRDQMHVGSQVIAALAESLLPLSDLERERLARTWVASRIGSCQPWR